VDDAALTSEERDAVRRVREFSRERVLPTLGRRGGFDRQLFCEAARLGVTGLLVPRNVGGLGLRHVAAARVLEELARISYPFAFSLFVQHNVISGIARYGTDAQIGRLLPNMLAGERVGAFCLTEPGAGSDAAGITTRAIGGGYGWELNGEKAWVTNGVIANVFSVYAQTGSGANWRTIACFLIEDDNPGVIRTKPYALLGAEAMAVSGLTLDRCRVRDDDLIGGTSDGFRIAMAGINRARAMIAVMCCGMLEESLEIALRYARTRWAFGKPIAQLQGIQFELADVATDLAAARLLAFRAVELLDRGEPVIVAAAHAKKFATRVALHGVSTCMRAMGANGLLDEYPLGSHLTSAQVCQYLDGTDEIQNIIIARDLLASEHDATTDN
jgi:alkylation response protein AidB-like acyl-CoA dehydrogenase